MKRTLFLAIAAMVLGLSVRSGAAVMNPFQHDGRVKAHTILLTGNYVQSRVLAELAQYYTKQPVLIISPDAEGANQVYYMPNSREAKQIPADEFMDVVNFITPKRVIILGNSDYVPASFGKELREKYSVISLDSADWSKNAASLSEILDEKRLKTKFEEYVRTASLSQRN